MSQFQSRWLDWHPENISPLPGCTDKTDKSPLPDPSVSFVSEIGTRSAQNFPNHRLDLADCCASLAALHAELAAGHEPGAVPWAFPDMKERYRAAEDRLDALAKTVNGPSEADWRAGLSELRTVWLEARELYRARQERRSELTELTKADPMPDLPAGATVAVGYSYADGRPGTWERGQ
jgi:hypothetical protein